MIQFLLPLLKYWKMGGVILLGAAFLICLHLAKSRGEKLELAEQTLKTERKNFQTQIKMIEKARQDEKERNIFRQKQNKKIRLADDSGLLDAYQRLREREIEHIGRGRL